jgi:hypothetical protein
LGESPLYFRLLRLRMLTIASILREVFTVEVTKEEPCCTSKMYTGFFLEGSEKEEKGFI